MNYKMCTQVINLYSSCKIRICHKILKAPVKAEFKILHTIKIFYLEKKML